MKKRTKFYALLFAMVLSLTQMIGAAVPVKAATKECSHGYTLVNGIGICMNVASPYVLPVIMDILNV